MSSNNKRTGKWTIEEEEYAEALSMSFHAGLLLGVEEGTSLRKLLAAKLFCSPKRISKKFEGTSYEGKKTYTRNIKASKEELDRNREHVALLEAKFIASINAAPSAESGSPTVQLIVGSSNALSRINLPHAGQWISTSQLERTTQLESLARRLAASNTTMSMGSLTQRPELTTTSSFPQFAGLPRSDNVAASASTQLNPSLDLARWLQLRSAGNIYRHSSHGASRPSSLELDQLLRIQMLRSANALSTTVPAVGANAAAGNLGGAMSTNVHGLRIPAGTLNPVVGTTRQQQLSSHEAQSRLMDQLLQSAAMRSDGVQRNNNAVDSKLSAGQKRPSLDAHDESETPLRKARK